MSISTLARKGLSVVAAGSLALTALVSAVAPASALGSDSLDVTSYKGFRAGVDYSGDTVATAELTTANNDTLRDQGNGDAFLIVVSQPAGGGVSADDFDINEGSSPYTTADIEFDSGGPASGVFAVAGDYVLRLTSHKGVVKDFTITVGGAPASVTFTPEQNPYPENENLEWTATLKDSAGRLTSLDSESLYVQVIDGFGNPVATPGTAITSFDWDNGVYTISPTAPAAGTYVIRAFLDASTDIYSANVTLVTKAKASLSTGNGQTFKASGSGIAGTGVSASGTSGNHTIRTDVPTVTYVFDGRSANAGTFVKFVATPTSGLGGTGDLTAAPKSGTWVLTDADGKASVAVTAKSPAATNAYTIAAVATGTSKTITSTYRAAGYGIEFKVVAPTVDDAGYRHVAYGSATPVSFKLVDVFGTPQANKRVTLGFDVADFAPAPSTGDTNADGVVSVTLTDTDKTFRTETVTATYVGASNTATESIYLIYVADATPASVNVTVTYRGGAAHNATTNNGTQPLYIDIADGASYGDVVETNVSVKNAAGGMLRGVPVTVTGGFSAADASADQADDMEATTEFVSTDTAVDVNLLSQKTGVITFTFSAAGKSATVTQLYANVKTDASVVTAVAAATAATSGTIRPVNFLVSDKYGNPVAGVTVVIGTSGTGRLVTGLTSATVLTSAAGIVGVDVVSAATDAGVQTVTAAATDPVIVKTATATVTWAVAAPAPKATIRAGGAKGTVVIAMGNMKGKTVQVFVRGKLVATVTPASNYVTRVIKGQAKGAATVVVKSGDIRIAKKISIK